jgi:hypothetical protein
MSGSEIRISSVYIGAIVIIVGQALMMAFLVGRQVDREDNLERQVEDLRRNGSAAGQIIAERQTVVMRNVDDLLKRVGALERASVFEHSGAGR